MSLLLLPPELLDEILSYLHYTSILALRHTCIPLYNFLIPIPPPPRWLPSTSFIPPPIIFAHARHFTDLSPAIPQDNEVLKREGGGQLVVKHNPRGGERRRCMLDLLVLELWEEFNGGSDYLEDQSGAARTMNLFACSLCLKLRPKSAFSTAQVAAHHGKGKYTALELLRLQDIVKDDYKKGVITQETRFCIECGVKHMKYAKGIILQFWEGVHDIVGEGKEEGDERALRAEKRDHEKIGTGIVCKRCGKFKVAGAETKAGIRRLCEPCLAYRPI